MWRIGNWLRILVTQVRQVLEFTPSYSAQTEKKEITEEDFQTYLPFLMQVLRAALYSQGDVEVVYPLLEVNTDKLNFTFARTLQLWATSTFKEVEADVQQSIAAVIFKLTTLIQQFPLGDKASNIEIVIAGYESILNVYTRQVSPQDWGMTQHNLAVAYADRIVGERSENIEKAIEFYDAALLVRTRQDFPQDWAMTQHGLGITYWDRIAGGRSENIEKAIDCYNAALLVYTRQALPQDWAKIQNDLGNAYSERIVGERSENIETAIEFYKAALLVYTRQALPQDWARIQHNLAAAYADRILGERSENIETAIESYNAALLVRTRQTFPQDWALTQNNLAAAYSERILGERLENIETAIEFYKAALLVHTRQAFPQDWAKIQNNLGNAYKNRIVGERSDNIEKAIDFYNVALLVYTRQAFPQDWAMTQHNLAAAYSNRIVGERSKNIEKAIEFYNATLLVRTRQAFPQDWAMTQHSLGIAYADRIVGERSENIEKAIEFYNAALLVRTRQAFPQDWAKTQHSLGIAYNIRIVGERSENIEKAIQFYNAALLIRTRQAFPQNHAETLFNLGRVYQDAGRFTSAYNTYESAIATVELLRSEIISGEESKRKQAEEWNQLYRLMVEVCLELGENSKALEYIERSKTRNLVELILEHDRKTIFPPDVVMQLERLQDEIAKGQYKIQNSTAENTTALAQNLQELRQQQNELQYRYLPVASGFNFEEFQKTLDENTGIIEWYANNAGLEIFIITRDRLQRVKLSASTDRLKALDSWIRKYLNAYYREKIEWISSLDSRLTQLAEILSIEEVLNLIPENCSHLVLVPYNYLHLFPLQALPLADGDLLCDRFPDGVSYAPSCQLLQQINLRQRLDFKSLFAIQNPTEDLYYTDLEVEIIASLFTDKEVLSRKQATQTALSQASSQMQEANYLHFSCHGTFNVTSPQDSCLLLAGSNKNDELDLSKCLTLGNLFEQDFNLNQCRLVVLSACETGLIDFRNTSDEYIGLSSGFLHAGSSSVVSSLWTVNDLSTSFLMIKFIQNLKDVEDISVSVALNQAQTWLRNATKEDLQKWTNDLPLDATKKGKIRRQLRNIDLEKPFNSPFHWAAFTAIGR